MLLVVLCPSTSTSYVITRLLLSLSYTIPLITEPAFKVMVCSSFIADVFHLRLFVPLSYLKFTEAYTPAPSALFEILMILSEAVDGNTCALTTFVVVSILSFETLNFTVEFSLLKVYLPFLIASFKSSDTLLILVSNFSSFAFNLVISSVLELLRLSTSLLKPEISLVLLSTFVFNVPNVVAFESLAFVADDKLFLIDAISVECVSTVPFKVLIFSSFLSHFNEVLVKILFKAFISSLLSLIF